MRIKKISKQKPKIKSRKRPKNESEVMEEKDFELKESSSEKSLNESSEINLKTSRINLKPKIKPKPSKIKPKMIKPKEGEANTMDFLKSELYNIIREEDENIEKKKQKIKKNPKAFKKLKEKEFLEVMVSIANSIEEIEIDLTRAVNLIKEIFNEPEEKDTESEEEGGGVKKVQNKKGVKKKDDTKGVKVKGDTKGKDKAKDQDKPNGAKKPKIEKIKDNKDISVKDNKDIPVKDTTLINPSIIQHSDPSYISFSGESYSIEKIIQKLKDKYKNNQFSSSSARSGMFTSSKRPKKGEWETFLEDLVEKNVLKKMIDGIVKYKF